MACFRRSHKSVIVLPQLWPRPDAAKRSEPMVSENVSAGWVLRVRVIPCNTLFSRPSSTTHRKSSDARSDLHRKTHSEATEEGHDGWGRLIPRLLCVFLCVSMSCLCLCVPRFNTCSSPTPDLLVVTSRCTWMPTKPICVYIGYSNFELLL